MDDDGLQTLVFDLGSTSFRIGKVDDTPMVDLTTAVGVFDDGTAVDTGRCLYPGVKCDNRINRTRRHYVNTNSLRVPKKDLEVVNCMKDGLIDDWDLFESLLDYVYSDCLVTESQYHPVLFSESPFNTKSKREQLVELMFEKYNLPSTFLCKNAVLAVFACHRYSGIIVDSGATHTSVIPIHNGYVVADGVVRSHVGGDYMTMLCKKFLSDNKIELCPQYMVAKHKQVKLNEKPIWTRKCPLLKLTESWNNYMTDLVVQDFKHSVLEVSKFPYNDLLVSSLPSCHYEFPTGYNQEFRNIRYKIPEAIFHPEGIVDRYAMSISKMIKTSVGLCDIALRPNMLSNIILTGGNSLIKGYEERLNRDFQNNIPRTWTFKIISTGDGNKRRFAMWHGGAIIASVGSVQELWFSRREFEEGGKTRIHQNSV